MQPSVEVVIVKTNSRLPKKYSILCVSPFQIELTL